MDNNQQQYHIVFTGTAKTLGRVLDTRCMNATVLAEPRTEANSKDVNFALHQKARLLYLDEVEKRVHATDGLGYNSMTKYMFNNEDWFPEIQLNQVSASH